MAPVTVLLLDPYFLQVSSLDSHVLMSFWLSLLHYPPAQTVTILVSLTSGGSKHSIVSKISQHVTPFLGSLMSLQVIISSCPVLL